MFFFFKQKTAYEMRISDWSSDVCSSDLLPVSARTAVGAGPGAALRRCAAAARPDQRAVLAAHVAQPPRAGGHGQRRQPARDGPPPPDRESEAAGPARRSEGRRVGTECVMTG